MIKVKIDQPGQSIFYVVDGYTVSYADDVLEVLNEDDETIAVFRSWIYAMPAEEIEEDSEEPEDDLELQDLGGIEVIEAEFLSDPETASHVHANHAGEHVAAASDDDDQP